MKESISYTFVLNIVILFIFLCMAIIMGIFSYYRAFRAGSIIVDTIEKYEGYNCLSAEEIGRKLSTISYDVPFDANCNKRDGSPCMVDSNKNYAVVSYNLKSEFDNSSSSYDPITEEMVNTSGEFLVSTNEDNIDYNNMNSSFYWHGNIGYTKQYQYGVFTYMYVDLPVVSNLLKLTVFSKTRIMYEFRDLLVVKGGASPKLLIDKRFIPEGLTISDREAVIYKKYSSDMIGFFDNLGDIEYNSRLLFQLDFDTDGKIDTSDVYLHNISNKCGRKRDYSKY
ncbi:MAG: hypothetical protein J6D28_03375 [Bacilli bacterium]|nr:hypothetical protein [Bacilli bacterium]